MSTIMNEEKVFVFKTIDPFNTLKTDRRAFAFESFLPGIEEVHAGEEITVEFGKEQLKAKVKEKTLPRPNMQRFGLLVELVAL